ncbi:MAG: hypothetical protein Q9183_000859 [Haloplaca sp. 2 TL-2023]
MPTNTLFPWLQSRSWNNRAARAGPQTMQEAVDGLNEASSSLRGALHQSENNAWSSASPSQSSVEDAAVEELSRRSSKRQKLNHGAPTGSLGRAPYGYYGQVVPGPLRMEIPFCDGGTYTGSGEREYPVENVLRNNLDVYCSKFSRCNMILRHVGKAPFSLSKLVIKAPESGFTAPIQEGMVFVAMKSHGLLTKTYRYTLRDPCPHHRHRHSRPASSSSGGMRRTSPHVPRAYRSLLNHHTHNYRHEDPPRPPSRRRTDDGNERVIPPPLSSLGHQHTTHSSHTSRTSQNPRPTQQPHSRAPSASQEPPQQQGAQTVNPTAISSPTPNFNITIDCEPHSSDGSEEESSEATLADRRYRDRIVPSSSSDTDDFTDAENEPVASASRNVRRRRYCSVPRMIELEPLSPEDVEEGKKEEVLAPHASFMIERGKSSVRIRFDPPM